MSWKNDQVSEAETAKILAVARECLVLSGDFVEMGCYRGDTSVMWAGVLREGVVDVSEGGDAETGFSQKKKLWLYDSFEGLPEKATEDESATGEAFVTGVLATSKRELKQRFLRSGLPVPKIVKGWFGDLTEAELPHEIAFGFLDGDFYRSTMDGLKAIWPRLVTGGVLLVHDYANEALPGVAKAVEEYFRVLGEEPRIEVTGSLAAIKKGT